MCADRVLRVPGRTRSCEREVRWAELVLFEMRLATYPALGRVRLQLARPPPPAGAERDQDRIWRRLQAELARACRPFGRAGPLGHGSDKQTRRLARHRGHQTAGSGLAVQREYALQVRQIQDPIGVDTRVHDRVDVADLQAVLLIPLTDS